MSLEEIEKLFTLPEQKPPKILCEHIDFFVHSSYNSSDVGAMNIVEYLLKKKYINMSHLELLINVHKATMVSKTTKIIDI